MNENQFQRALLDRLEAIADALDSIRHELKKHEPPTVEVRQDIANSVERSLRTSASMSKLRDG